MSTLKNLATEIIADTDLWSRSNLNVRRKSDGSPVSSTDIKIDARIRAFLESEFPNTQIISEEDLSWQKAPVGQNVAVVDPLDGTENYVSGLPIWGVSVSIWQKGHHHSSMLVFPELSQSLVTDDICEYFESQVEGHSSSSSLEVLARTSKAKENRILGCAAYNLFGVSTGRFTHFANHVGANAWDIIAGLNLALEHGCGVKVNGTKYSGEFLDPSRRHRFEVQR